MVINGIGYGSDIEQTGFNEDGSPILKPGYFYVDNTEYYLFASGVLADLSESEDRILCENLVSGSPYFVIPEESIQTLKVYGSNSEFYYIKTNDAIPASGLLFDGNDWYFEKGSNAGFLIYEAGSEIVLNKDVVEESTLVIDSEAPTLTSNIEIRPVWLQSANIGMPVPISVKVRDMKGTLLIGKTIEWHRVFTRSGPELYQDETHLRGPYPEPLGNFYDVDRLEGPTTVTDSNGVTIYTLIPIEGENDLFIYGKDAETGLKSNLLWIQIHIPQIQEDNIFQLDSPGVFYGVQSAFTAVGLDVWGHKWSDADPDYNAIATLQPNDGYLTRGDWKIAHSELERPPINSINSKNEAMGYYNIDDFAQDNLISDADFLQFAFNQRCAVGGYWGQVIIPGSDLGFLTATCLNPTASVPIDFDDVEQPGWSFIDFLWTNHGTYQEVINNPLYANLWFALYAPGYMDNNIADFSNGTVTEFYFRGVAIPNLNPNSPDYRGQNYKIINMIPQSVLRGG